MILILTGCDRSGKTTLANKLIKELERCADTYNTKIEYKHFSHPSSLEEAKQEYFDFINSTDENTIYIVDRFYECEDIYAPIYRHYSLNYQKEIESLLNTKDTMFVYVQTSLDTIKERIKQVGENFVNHDDLSKIIDKYEAFFMKTKIPYMVISGEYNINDKDETDKLVFMIIHYLFKVQELNEYYNEYKLNRSYGKINSNTILVNSMSNSINISNCWVANDDTYEFDIKTLNINTFTM